MRRVTAVLVGLLLMVPCYAVACDAYINPYPDSNDLLLPMPGDAAVAFRKVTVPGESFWFDPARIKRLGDPQGDVFSRERSLEVYGSFSAPGADSWWYFIGKYEITKGQYAALMGGGDLNAGLRVLAENSGNPEDAGLARLEGKARCNALAEPLRWMRVADLEAFVERYNEWLFDPEHPARLEQVPKLTYLGASNVERSTPGFIRLPTEIEWEFAVRGGASASDDAFSRRAPYADGQAELHAWLRENARSQVKPIGRRDPLFGLYDTIGNVNELVLHHFQPEIGRGKLGGRIVRGGSVLTDRSSAASGLRQELATYQFASTGARIEAARSPVTGIRLAIGTLVKPDAELFSILQQEYDAALERRSASSSAEPGGGQQAKINLSTEALIRTKEGLERIKSSNQSLAHEVDALIQSLGRAQQLQDQEIQTITIDLIMVAVDEAADYGRDCVRLEDRQRLLPVVEKHSKTGTQAQQNYQDIVRQISGFEQRIQSTALEYKRTLERLQSYGEAYYEKAYKQVQKRPNFAKIDRVALKVVNQHLPGIRRGNLALEAIKGDLRHHLCLSEMR